MSASQRSKEIKLQHEKRFLNFREWAEEFYFDYENKDKIICLIDYWLFSVRVFIDCYGIDGIKQFSHSKSGCFLRYSWKIEHDLDITIKTSNQKGLKLFSRLLLMLSNKLILPGADTRSFLDKIRLRYTVFIINKFNVKVDEERKQEFILATQKYFDDLDELDISDWFIRMMPKAFFSNQIFISNRRLNIECAPSEFYEYKGLENLFLVDKHVYLKGRQHGGGYGAYEIEYLTEYAKKISNEYLGWGLAQNNTRQHKYYDQGEILYKDSNKKRLIWVERGRSPLIYSFLWHDYEVETIAYVAHELELAGIQYFNIPYYEPYGSSNLYEGSRGEVLTIRGRRSEGIINKSDVVIFDTCGPTMLHYCLEYEIAFLLVLNERSIERFTSKQKEWFNILSDNQLAFLDNEVGNLSSSIKNIMSEEYYIPAEVRTYHEQQFTRI